MSFFIFILIFWPVILAGMIYQKAMDAWYLGRDVARKYL